jgi:FkbM family methyltransferase
MLSAPALLDYTHRRLARFHPAVLLALLLRNQMQCVLKYHLGGVAAADRNGEQLLARAVAPHCRTFVDVGANVGSWSEYLLAHAGTEVRGLLFEPSAAALTALRSRSSLAGPCEIVPAAVSDSVGEVEFFEEPSAGETSSLDARTSLATASVRRVPCTTVERAVAEHGWDRIDFLKVDVEGFDLHVLRGCGSYLRERRIGIIQFEYNSSWATAGSTLSSALRLLSDSGYEVRLLRKRGLYGFSYDTFGEFLTYANFVAMTPELAGSLRPLERGVLGPLR